MDSVNQEKGRKSTITATVRNTLQMLFGNKRRLLWIVLVAVVCWFAYKVFLSFHFFGLLPHQTVEIPTKDKFQVSDFSPDGNKLYLDYCVTSGHCNIGQFDVLSQKVSLFVPQDTKDVIASPSSSDDGKKLAVVIKEAANDYDTSQIGILDLATNTYHAVTRSLTFKEWPSFSHDGKKIIYAQANRKRENGKTRYSEWDIYEMELATGVERRLTNFCFFLAGRPQYAKNDKQFVFSGEAPSCNFPTQGDHASGYEAYKNLYQENTVFLMSGGETTLKPLFVNGADSHGAVLSRDGNYVFFISRTNEMDGIKCCYYNYDLFVYENGLIHRISNLQTVITGLAVSFHGEQVAYLSDKQRNRNNALWLMDITTKKYKHVAFEEHSKFSVINISTK